MAFGLWNGPSVFQRLMDIVLHDNLYCSHGYIDDIVIYSCSWEDYCAHLIVVLEKLRDAGLTLKVSKCQWGVASCVYLGFVVGNGLRSPEDCKVNAIKALPIHHSKSQIRSFLGITSYYRDFIPAYASHSFYLTEATKKSNPDTVTWNDDLDKDYCYLRNCLSSSCLCILVCGDNFCLQTDASGVGIGAILSVVRDGHELPLSYYSHKLLLAERNYAIIELECLAIVASIATTLRGIPLLMGVHFTIETDHKALSFINSAKTLTGRLARWALLLQEFDFKIRYRPGSKNTMLIPFLVSFPRMFPDERLHLILRGGRCCATPQHEHR